MGSEAAYDQLNERQCRFVDEYLLDPNATQAALKAGYSSKTAHVTGSENLKKPKIRAVIARSRTERTERVKIAADWVLFELVNLYYRCREAGNLAVAKSTLDSIGKHVDVQAFKENGTSDSVYDALEYVLEQREKRRAQKDNGDGRLGAEPSLGIRENRP